MLSQKLVIHILQFKYIYYFLVNIYIYICVMENMKIAYKIKYVR